MVLTNSWSTSIVSLPEFNQIVLRTVRPTRSGDVAIFSDVLRPRDPFPPPDLGTRTHSRTPARLFPSFTSSYSYGKCIKPLGHAYLAQ